MTDAQFNSFEAAVKGWSIASLVVSAILCALMAVSMVLSAIGNASWSSLGALIGLPIYLILISFTVLIVTSLPAAGLVWIVRLARLPRPLGDIIGGAIVPLLWTSVIFRAHGVIYGLNPIEIALAILGAVGGAVYWYAAGKPKPPYAAA